MKKGDIVKIYQKPVTEEEYEGDAKLIALLISDMGTWEDRQLQMWKVKFLNDGYVCDRKILEPSSDKRNAKNS